MCLTREMLEDIAGREDGVAYYLMLRGHSMGKVRSMFAAIMETAEAEHSEFTVPPCLKLENGPDSITMPFERSSERVALHEEES